MANLAKLVVQLEAESSKLRTELERTNKQMNAWAQRATKSAERVKSQFKSLAVVAAGALGVRGVGAAISNALNEADQLGKMAVRLGASTEALSEYKHVAELSGVQFDQLTTGWQRMTRRIAEASYGTGEAKKALSELGLSAVALAQLKPEHQFEAIANAMQGAAGAGDRVRLAMKIFDSGGVKLIQTMQGGAAAIHAARDEARRFGLTISTDFKNNAAKANDSIARLKAVAHAVSLTVARELAPSIAAAADMLRNNFGPALEAVRTTILQGRVLFAESAATIAGWAEAVVGAVAAINEATGFDKLAKKQRDMQTDLQAMSRNWQAVADRISKTDLAPDAGIATRAGQTFAAAYQKALAEASKLPGVLSGSTDELLKASKQAETFKDLIQSTRDSLTGASAGSGLVSGTVLETLRELRQGQASFGKGEFEDAAKRATRAVETIKDLADSEQITKQYAEALIKQAEAIGSQAFNSMAAIQIGIDHEALKSATQRAIDQVTAQLAAAHPTLVITPIMGPMQPGQDRPHIGTLPGHGETPTAAGTPTPARTPIVTESGRNRPMTSLTLNIGGKTVNTTVPTDEAGIIQRAFEREARMTGTK